MYTVTAYSLHYEDGYSSNKVYRIYVIEPDNKAQRPWWVAQWGKWGIPMGGGQWQNHSDGYASHDMALRMRDTKEAKGYEQIGYATWTTNNVDNYSLDRDLNKYVKAGAKQAAAATPVPEPPLPADLRASLVEMMKKAGRTEPKGTV